MLLLVRVSWHTPRAAAVQDRSHPSSNLCNSGSLLRNQPGTLPTGRGEAERDETAALSSLPLITVLVISDS